MADTWRVNMRHPRPQRGRNALLLGGLVYVGADTAEKAAELIRRVCPEWSILSVKPHAPFVNMREDLSEFIYNLPVNDEPANLGARSSQAERLDA